MAFRPAGTVVAAAGGDGALVLWRTDGTRVWGQREEGPGKAVRCLAFHPSAAWLAAGTSDGRVVLFDLKQGQRLSESHAGETAVQALAFSRDGRLLATGSADRQVRLWDSARLEPRSSWKTGAPVSAVAFARGDEYLATGGDNVQFWETAGGRRVWELEVPRGPVRALALNEDRGELAAADQGSQVLLFDLRDLGARLRELGLDLPVVSPQGGAD
jgi:WD40 repeat protein